MKRVWDKIICPGCQAEINFNYIPPLGVRQVSEKPEILHLSLRLSGLKDRMPWDGRPDRKPLPDGLGIALYFVFGKKGAPLEENQEYGLSFNLPLAKLEELMQTGEVLVHEYQPREARLKEGQMMNTEDVAPVIQGCWKCVVCGAVLDVDASKFSERYFGGWRWAADHWEHNHGYPVGHCRAEKISLVSSPPPDPSCIDPTD